MYVECPHCITIVSLEKKASQNAKEVANQHGELGAPSAFGNIKLHEAITKLKATDWEQLNIEADKLIRGGRGSTGVPTREALGLQNCGLVNFYNIYINTFSREKLQKIKEYGHTISYHLEVHVIACLFVPYLCGRWGKRTALRCSQRTLCSFDADLQQKRSQQIACSRAAAHQSVHWLRSAFTSGTEVSLLFLLFFHCMDSWDKPRQEKMVKAKQVRKIAVK